MRENIFCRFFTISPRSQLLELITFGSPNPPTLTKRYLIIKNWNPVLYSLVRVDYHSVFVKWFTKCKFRQKLSGSGFLSVWWQVRHINWLRYLWLKSKGDVQWSSNTTGDVPPGLRRVSHWKNFPSERRRKTLDPGTDKGPRQTW